MSVIAVEGIVEEGKIRLENNFFLPDKTKVIVFVPEFKQEKFARILSPRLANSKKVKDFEMEISEERPNASV